MVYFNFGIAEQEIIKECFLYLPNPNDVQDTVYKIPFVIKHSMSPSPDYTENPDTIKVYSAQFKIEYEETGSKRWEFDRFDSNINTELAVELN